MLLLAFIFCFTLSFSLNGAMKMFIIFPVIFVYLYHSLFENISFRAQVPFWCFTNNLRVLCGFFMSIVPESTFYHLEENFAVLILLILNSH